MCIGASVEAEDLSENDRGALVVLVLGDKTYGAIYKKKDRVVAYGIPRMRVSENWMDYFEINSNWFSNVHVVLDKYIRC